MTITRDDVYFDVTAVQMRPMLTLRFRENGGRVTLARAGEVEGLPDGLVLASDQGNVCATWTCKGTAIHLMSRMTEAGFHANAQDVAHAALSEEEKHVPDQAEAMMKAVRNIADRVNAGKAAAGTVPSSDGEPN